MELHLKTIGLVSILLALLHPAFPRYFNWNAELGSLSLINRQLMYVHTFFVALTVLLMGLFCIFCAGDIVHTRLGNRIAAGLFVFSALRLFCQFFVYSPALWKGKAFETGVHIVFSMLWIYFSAIFLLISLAG